MATNPRGIKRPQDGRGRGVGVTGGRGGNRNTKACPTGPGRGAGGGRGGGRNR